MPRRFKAPQHTSGVFTPGSGEIRANEHGILELPDEAGEADLAVLIRAGCVEAPSGEESALAEPPAGAEGEDSPSEPRDPAKPKK